LILRVGQIDYANCTPIFAYLKNAFDCRNYRFIRGVPSHLNGMLSSGEIDVCPSSSIEFAKYPLKYLLLPDLSVSSIGPVKSVLLFSRLPLEELNRQTVGLTTESATSVNLLKIVLGKFYGYDNCFIKMKTSTIDSLSEFPAILLIGDTALKTGLQCNKCVHVYDLGELWYKFTGLPFVFALWLVREETAVKLKREVQTLCSRLCFSKKMACTSFETIASGCEEEWISESEMISYWKTISYDLSLHHLEGLRAFFRYSAELGIVDREPEIRLFT
jgi:chorismate dehydratase